MMQSFSGYSFCKPHSASYAMLSFTCAYLKTHFPAEFMAAVVSNQGGFYSAYAYLSEARRRGVDILLPDINESEREYTGNSGFIRIGFMAIKELQGKTIDRILLARKSGYFTSLEDFLIRIDCDISDAIALTRAQCFNGLEPDLSYQQIAFAVVYFFRDPEHQYPMNSTNLLPNTTLSDEEKRQLEIASFGFPVSEHPLKRYIPLFRDQVIKARDIHRHNGESIFLAGVYITRKVTATKKDEPMEFVTFEDETDIYECVMFPKIYEQYADLLIWETLFIVKGTVDEAFGVYTINIEKLYSLQKFAERRLNQNRMNSLEIKM